MVCPRISRNGNSSAQPQRATLQIDPHSRQRVCIPLPIWATSYDKRTRPNLGVMLDVGSMLADSSLSTDYLLTIPSPEAGTEIIAVDADAFNI